MAQERKKPEIATLDDLFGLSSPEERREEENREKVFAIPLTEIDAFPDHPFQVKMDESMQTMADSAKAVGIQTPAIVRQKDDGRYELVSGHRRKMACELAGLDTMPCIIRQMSRDEAVIAMVDANLQRETILPSEKAKSYKMKLEALSRQGQRTDLTSVPVGPKLRSNEEVAQSSGESATQIKRYIRLNDLIPPVLEMVDTGKIAMRPAVELSFLPPEQQAALVEEMAAEESTPSHVQAAKMRKFSQEGQLNEGVIRSILQEEKPNQVEVFKIPREKISRFFPVGTSAETIESTIIKALEMYRNRERQRDAR